MVSDQSSKAWLRAPILRVLHGLGSSTWARRFLRRRGFGHFQHLMACAGESSRSSRISIHKTIRKPYMAMMSPLRPGNEGRGSLTTSTLHRIPSRHSSRLLLPGPASAMITLRCMSQHPPAQRQPQGATCRGSIRTFPRDRRLWMSRRPGPHAIDTWTGPAARHKLPCTASIYRRYLRLFYRWVCFRFASRRLSLHAATWQGSSPLAHLEGLSGMMVGRECEATMLGSGTLSRS